jgi:hypothetical protein
MEDGMATDFKFSDDQHFKLVWRSVKRGETFIEPDRMRP